jgi:hypothetical protein
MNIDLEQTDQIDDKADLNLIKTILNLGEIWFYLSPADCRWN